MANVKESGPRAVRARIATLVDRFSFAFTVSFCLNPEAGACSQASSAALSSFRRSMV